MQNRAVWLMSSNIINVGFYNSLGFYSVYDFSLGDDNPTWNRDPFVFQIVRLYLDLCNRVTEYLGRFGWSERRKGHVTH